jgi:hypothetical protein
MTIPPALLVLLGLLVVGVIDSIIELVRTLGRWRFTEIYGARFDDFVNGLNRREYDGKTDVWLNRKLPAMIAELKSVGGLLYKAPWGAYTVANYSLLADTVTKLSQGLAEPEAVNFSQRFLLQHAGYLQGQTKRAALQLLNPFSWLLRGVGWILSLPLLVVGGNVPVDVRKAGFFRFVQGVGALLVTVKAFMDVVGGWDSFLKQLSRWIR